MDLKISHSVGSSGVNNKADVTTIQKLLNKVPTTWGGPDPKLKEDGIIGIKTNAAILQFQQVQLKGLLNPDGRIDPKRTSIGRLNHIANTSEVPGAFFSISVEPVAHVTQPTNMTCWAAAGTMLVGAKDKMCYTIPVVMAKADAGDPGYGYLAMFAANKGLPPADTGRYTRSLKLKVAPPMSFSLLGWKTMMAAHGALGVVGLTPFLHIRVTCKIFGDGSVFGSYLKVLDPGVNAPYDELFINFAKKYEDAAFINFKMDQIWHK